MNYFSTRRQSPAVDFKAATIQGQAPDGGLYFPEQLPRLEESFIRDLVNLSKEDIASHVISPYVGNSIPEDELKRIVAETVNFDIPLVGVTEKISSLELFHGPTLAFKDIGARFMSRCLGYFLREEERTVTVLVATSGDTGGAVASGFYKVPGVEVVILFPSGKVSPVQEKQLTTLGENIHALEVDGSFDDCQRMVKQAFIDAELTDQLFLTSANSINVARWLPQQFYYFFACQQWTNKNNAPTIAVPSGNFGNICAGLLARHSGLPLGHFIAACNVNDVISEYLETGTQPVKDAVPTISNAMDVANPSNFVRVLEIFGGEIDDLKTSFSSTTITDQETLETITRVQREHDYLLDPHGAVAWKALENYLDTNPQNSGIILETAHPVKFPEAVQEATGQQIPIPDRLASIMTAKSNAQKIANDFTELKSYLLRKER